MRAHERTWTRTRTRACTARKCINRSKFDTSAHLNMFSYQPRSCGLRVPRRRCGIRCSSAPCGCCLHTTKCNKLQQLREPKIWWISGLGFQNSFFCFGTVWRTNTSRGSFTKSVLEQLRKPNCFTQAKRSEKPTVLERFLGFFVLEQFGQPTRRRTALQKSGLEQLVYSLVYSFQCSQTVF